MERYDCMSSRRKSAPESGTLHKAFHLIVALLAVALIAASCSSDDDSAPEELKVGYLMALEEQYALWNDPIVKAMELARNEINAAGGNLVLVPGDTGFDLEVANQTADTLIAEGVSAIVGADASHISLGVIDKITGSDVVMISPTSAAPVLSHYEDGGYFFRVIPSEALSAIEMADLMQEAGVSNVGIVYLDNAFGLGSARALQDRLIEGGVRVGLMVPYDPPGEDIQAEADLEADVQLLKDARVDGVAIIAFNQTATIVAHKLEVGIDVRTIPFFIRASVSGGDWIDTDPDDPGVLDGTTVVLTAEEPEAGEPTFGSRYEAYAGEGESLFAAYGYDAVVVVALASLAAGSTDPVDFVGEMNAVTKDGVKCNLYAACAELIRDGEDIDYDGASGVLDFIPTGEPSNGAYDIFEFNDRGTLDFVSHEVVHVDEL